MEKDRFEQLKCIVELDYKDRHDAPSLYFTHDDLKWLIKQSEKYKKIEQSWKEGIEEHKETIFFLRTCKEAIEDFKTETRKRMS